MSLPEGARVTEREGGGDTPAGRVAPVERLGGTRK